MTVELEKSKERILFKMFISKKMLKLIRLRRELG